MNDEYRRPQIIQQELSSLQELIRKNGQLISSYPDDFALKLNLKSLKNREENLLSELVKTFKRLQMDTFDIVVEGDPVNGNSISVSYIGQILVKFQEVITSIAQSITEGSDTTLPISQSVIEGSRFNLIATCSGSFRIILSSYQPAIGESLAKNSLNNFNKLIECGDNRELIKGQIKELGTKVIAKYRVFLNTIYKNNSSITLYDKIRPESFQTMSISNDVAKKIYDVIIKEEEIPEKNVDFKGILKAINLFSFTFEFLVNESDERIKGTFDENLVLQVKNHFDKVSTALFRLSTQLSEVTDEEKIKWKLLGFKE